MWGLIYSKIFATSRVIRGKTFTFYEALDTSNNLYNKKISVLFVTIIILSKYLEYKRQKNKIGMYFRSLRQKVHM